MNETAIKGYIAMAMDQAGYDEEAIVLVFRAYDSVKNVTKEEAIDFYKNKSYIHEKKEEEE